VKEAEEVDVENKAKFEKFMHELLMEPNDSGANLESKQQIKPATDRPAT